jgi:formate-dependent nitrite reductase membrane component NrfD
VKGAFIIAGYTIVLALHFIASWAGSRSFQSWLMIAGIPLSILTAVYTAYLFAQAKARDMWQNPLLPPHLFFQAVLLGSAVLLLLIVVLRGPMASDELMGFIDTLRPEIYWLFWTLGVASMIHLLMVWGEVSLTHPTAHARLAIWEMVKGRYKTDFWTGTILSLLGGLLPLLAVLGVLSISIGVAGAPLALIGLMLFENAYVQAGQSVPLA